MLDLVEVGDARIPGEVIALDREIATVQVYEYTGGLRPGDPVEASGGPLAELGPGLLGGVFDGMLRPLGRAPEFLEVGARPATLDRDRPWQFTPALAEGDAVEPGAVLGHVVETASLEHRPLVPPVVAGRLEWIAPAGEYRVHEPISAWPDTSSRSRTVGPSASHVRCARAYTPPSRWSPACAFSTSCTRWRGEARQPSPAASEPARRCSSTRSRSGATRT